MFVFASTLNSDCILRLDTTIIINFPRLLFDSCCHKDEMMDNVRCGNWMSWGEGKGKGRQMFHDEILNLDLGLQSRGLKEAAFGQRG